jgi:ribosomal protein RSM22 (predicted rRNA methylase)
LTAAIQAGIAGSGIPSLSAGVQRLMTAYRSGEVPELPVMAAKSDVAAYAAYRMPATAAAAGQAVRELRRSLRDWKPVTLLDFGAGTGAAAWAVADEAPSIASITLLEQSGAAIRLGKAIFAAADAPSLRTATWRSWRLSAGGPASRGAPAVETAGGGSADAGLPIADLATAAYILGELTPVQQSALVALATSAAPVVLIVEPGTPAGHRRILAARAQLLAAGYVIAAPCPHQLDCPLAVEGDWCHFGARLQRSSIHREAKGAELPYEDEKYSYVAAVSAASGIVVAPSPGRIVRRPQQRKGLVLLDLCSPDGSSQRDLVSKSKGDAYRRARKVAWGERWPPAGRE